MLMITERRHNCVRHTHGGLTMLYSLFVMIMVILAANDTSKSERLAPSFATHLGDTPCQFNTDISYNQYNYINKNEAIKMYSYLKARHPRFARECK